jgi:hypothetical protein
MKNVIVSIKHDIWTQSHNGVYERISASGCEGAIVRLWAPVEAAVDGRVHEPLWNKLWEARGW